MVADVYIYSNIRRGFTRNVNRGWKVAASDYVAIVNSDIKLLSDNVKDLCIPDQVTCPGKYPVVTGHFFVAPKEVTEKYGMLDESMTMWWSDADYGRRVWEIYTPVPSVKIDHLGGTTHKRDPGLLDKWYHIDGAAYNSIWNGPSEWIDDSKFERINKIIREAEEDDMGTPRLGPDNIQREVQQI